MHVALQSPLSAARGQRAGADTGGLPDAARRWRWALALGGGVGGAGGGGGRDAVGVCAPVGGFVVGWGVAGGEDGGGGGVDAGGEQPLVLGPGGAVGGAPGRRTPSGS